MNNFANTPITELAAIIANHLDGHGIQVVLVGGLAVEIYSKNIYLTKDIDMVNTSYDSPSAINQAMADIGFVKTGRVYINETTDISVEFPSAPLSVGEELIVKTTSFEVKGKTIPILLAKDVVKDRLAAYFHWNDRPSLVQALAILSNHSIPTKELKSFCEKEGKADAFENLQKLQAGIKARKISSMEDIESYIIEHTLHWL